MEFIFKFHSLFSVVRQLLITFAMLHSVTNHNVRCILLVNGNTSLVNIHLQYSDSITHNLPMAEVSFPRNRRDFACILKKNEFNIPEVLFIIVIV